MNTGLPRFDPASLSEVARENMLDELRSLLVAVNRKIDRLNKGDHTTLSEDGMRMLVHLRDEVCRRVDVLIHLQGCNKERLR